MGDAAPGINGNADRGGDALAAPEADGDGAQVVGDKSTARRKGAVNQMQDLLHEALIDTGHVQVCALVLRRDGAIRATSLGYKPQKKSIGVLIDNFKRAPMERFRRLEFEGKTYATLRNDGASMYGREVGGIGCGLVVTLTSSFILYGTYSVDMHASICVEAIEKLGDYIRDKGK